MDEITSAVRKETLKVSGEYKNLRRIRAFVNRLTGQAGFGEEESYKVQLAVDEACSNIIEHAYGGENKGEIECVCAFTKDLFFVQLKDQGRPFNPDSIEFPDLKSTLQEREIGGLGVYFIRQLMDKISYKSIPISVSGESHPMVNELTMVKRRTKV